MEKPSSANQHFVALNCMFNAIHSLVLKSFLVPFSQIVLIDGERINIKSNDEAVDGKSFLYQRTIFEESILKRNVLLAQDVAVADLYQNIPFYASAPLHDSLGNVMGCLIILSPDPRDFSTQDSELLVELANVVSLMLQRHQEIERVKEVYADFIHKAVHDLKNPLSSISLTAELIKRKANDPEVVVKFADRIEKSNTKLFHRLAHLKPIFPHHNKSFKLAITEIDIDLIFTDVQKSVSRATITVDNSLSEKIHGNYQRLKDSILLLITQLISAAEKEETIFIKSYLKDSSAVIEISGGNTNCHTIETVQTSTAIQLSRILIELQKGSLDLDLLQNSCYFYISFPLLTS